MPTTNLRKHTIPSGADKSFNRATIFEAFGNSIHDIVPVANTTERAQLVAALNAKGAGPTAANPLVVHRADAPGLHRIEYSADGTVWLSDVLFFTTKDAADSFAASNGGLLTVGDECQAGSMRYAWSGTAWLELDTGWVAVPTLGQGWSALPGAAPRVRRVGKQVFLEGALNLGGGAAWANLLTIPEGFRPKRNTYTGTLNSSQAGIFALGVVNTAGLVYGEANSGSASAPMYLPLHMTWFVE